MTAGMMTAAAGGGGGNNAVTFDGSTNYLSAGGTFDNVSDTKIVTGSFWINESDGLGSVRTIYQHSSDWFKLDLRSGNHLAFTGRNSDLSQPLDAITTAAFSGTGTWINVLFSFDLSDSGKRSVYIADSVESMTWNAFDDKTINVGGTNPAIIGATTSGAAKFEGDMYDFWLDFNGAYIDFSTESNRRKFIDASGKAVPLGANGETPTGTAPSVFQSGSVNNWHVNKGLGGNGFTANGTFLKAATDPSE